MSSSQPSSSSSSSRSFIDAWNTVATTPGVCRNPEYTAWVNRSLGYDGMIATFNPSHALTKRTTTIGNPSPPPPNNNNNNNTSITTSNSLPIIPVRREFNKDGFHFGKIKAQEIVCRVYLPVVKKNNGDDDDEPNSFSSSVDTTTTATTEQDKFTWLATVPSSSATITTTPASLDDIPDEHYVLINVSPLCEGHSLFIPSVFSFFPQVMNQLALYLGCRLSKLMDQPDFRLGFNSLGAFASVNHLHFHIFFTQTLFPLLKNTFPCENAERGSLVRSIPINDRSSIYIYPVHWHVKGYVFTLNMDSSSSSSYPSDSSSHIYHQKLCKTVYQFIFLLQEKDIAHHVLISDYGQTIYVFPRLKQRPSFQGRAQIALGEVCGLGIVTDPTAFYTPEELLQQQQKGSNPATTITTTASSGDLSTSTLPDNTLREMTGKDFIQELQFFSYSFDELGPILTQSIEP